MTLFLEKVLYHISTQIVLCFILLLYIGTISDKYSVVFHIREYSIDISFFLIIALLISIIVKYKLHCGWDNNEFHYFFYWLIVIGCIVILLMSYFETKDNQDYLLHTYYFNIKYNYTLQYKVQYIDIIIDLLLSKETLSAEKAIFLKCVIKENTFLFGNIDQATLLYIKKICILQGDIASVVYDNNEVITRYYIEYTVHPIVSIISKVSKALLILFQGNFFLSKISPIILTKYFHEDLIAFIEAQLMAQNVVFNMSPGERQDLLLLLAILIKNHYEALTLLVAILRYKYGF